MLCKTIGAQYNFDTSYHTIHINKLKLYRIHIWEIKNSCECRLLKTSVTYVDVDLYLAISILIKFNEIIRYLEYPQLSYRKALHKMNYAIFKRTVALMHLKVQKLPIFVSLLN